MTAGSAMLSLSIAFNALSEHGTCTAVFVAISFVLVFILSSIRTLGRLTWIAWVGVACIIVAGKRKILPGWAPLLTSPSVRSYNSCRHPTTTHRSVSRHDLEIRLQAFRSTQLRSSFLRRLDTHLCLRRYGGLLPDRVGDARSPTFYTVFGSLSDISHRHLPYCWCGRLLLLRLVCGLASPRISGTFDQESQLWYCVSRPIIQWHAPSSCKESDMIFSLRVFINSTLIGFKQVYLRPYPAGVETPDLQLVHPLGYMVGLYVRCRPDSLHPS